MTRLHEEARTGFRATFRPLVDDRGENARRLRQSDLTRATDSADAALSEVARRLRYAAKSEARRITPDRLLFGVLAVLLVFFGYGVFAVVTDELGMLSFPIGIIAFVLFVATAHFAFTWYIRRGSLNQLARTAVAEGVCGACAFSLEGAPTNEGPATELALVCPECGAAWSPERVVQPFWEHRPRVVLRESFLASIMPGVLPRGLLYAPDDRGRFVPTPDSRLMRLSVSARDHIPKRERRALVRKLRRIGLIPRLVVAGVVGLIPGAFFYHAWNAYHNLDREFWALLILGAVTTVPVMLIALSAAFSMPHRTSRAIVRHGRCGSCMRPLDDATGDDQSRSICRDCGSAWLRPSRTQPGS